ncbi:uncharacterized protein N0V89_012122 [Didymosphaeria variabile]|uniref:Uncharacterized protein n=1 Tax=Didymosphaeria variabile TaxID=1932322 RepID=A0A9W9C4Q5_9PLEO|nr:uncharacterized protein N0V89_012122 [Didymosphaeria variabile]KAJ4344382.1 hypothetical protein N0V89_012122 [Didymosphaeria variabile]
MSLENVTEGSVSKQTNDRSEDRRIVDGVKTKKRRRALEERQKENVAEGSVGIQEKGRNENKQLVDGVKAKKRKRALEERQYSRCRGEEFEEKNG